MNHDDANNSKDAAVDDWIDDLLRSREAATLEAAPNAVRVAAAAAIAQLKRHRLRRRSLAGLAAAAALGAIALWQLSDSRRDSPLASAPGSARGSNDQVSVPRDATPRQSRGLQELPATFVSSDAIAVPVESPTPEVTIVQVYPTVDAQRRQRRQTYTVAHYAEPNGG